ncbi:MAG TPA: chorismate mutase [Candidatus Nanopelagicales bacterium]|nr:chorismate mutase [Candidatus Nanopelagicales bacterium]
MTDPAASRPQSSSNDPLQQQARTHGQDPEGEIAALRGQIDEADAAIVAAIEQRRSLSARIQEVRRTAGGPQREPSREDVVVAAYADRLGHGGEDVGRAVLRACLPPGS